MRIFYCDEFVLPLPPQHRFPMAKYRRLRERVVADGLADECDLRVPAPATDEQLARAHTPDWVARVRDGRLRTPEIRRIGFPWSAELVERSRRSVGGTIAAGREALSRGTAVNLAGGTHHAFADRGEGYCVFNDAAVAARDLQASGAVDRVLIVDTDVHQGNGTAAIFVDDPTVFTFSIHGSRNFPFRKETSDLDVALSDGAGDQEYLAELDRGLREAFELARADIVIWVSGADPYAGDRLGRLRLTKAGLAARDAAVLASCRAQELPVAVVMAGGYSPSVADIVDIHAATVAAARRHASAGSR